MEKWTHAKNLVLLPKFLAKNETISKNHELDEGFRRKWRTAVPLWPHCALKAPPGRPKACPGAPRERPESVRARLIVENNWTHPKKHKSKQKKNIFSKMENKKNLRTSRIESARQEGLGGRPVRPKILHTDGKRTHTKKSQKDTKSRTRTKKS